MDFFSFASFWKVGEEEGKSTLQYWISFLSYYSPSKQAKLMTYIKKWIYCSFVLDKSSSLNYIWFWTKNHLSYFFPLVLFVPLACSSNNETSVINCQLVMSLLIWVYLIQTQQKLVGIVSVDDLMCKTISEESCRSLLRCMGSVQADIPDWHYQTHIIILTELGGWPFFDHTHTCLEHCSFKKVGKCQRSNQVQDWNELRTLLCCVSRNMGVVARVLK